MEQALLTVLRRNQASPPLDLRLAASKNAKEEISAIGGTHVQVLCRQPIDVHMNTGERVEDTLQHPKMPGLSGKCKCLL